MINVNSKSDKMRRFKQLLQDDEIKYILNNHPSEKFIEQLKESSLETSDDIISPLVYSYNNIIYYNK